MMTWNYRIIKVIDPKTREAWYSIRETYYNPLGWSAEPDGVQAESIDGLKWQLEMMAKALDKEVIAFEEEAPTRESE
jgi:hypothetical protein